MNQATKHNSITLSGVWLTVVLLVILILASLALLGSMISGYVQGEPNVIELMLDSNALQEQYGDDLPAGALPDMEARDKQVLWETETSVDLFKTAYTGPDGTITVESANGDKVIAPGTENTYQFTLKNTGNISLDYTLELDGVFKLTDRDIPMFVRLRQDGKWLMGGADSWLHVDELDNLTQTDTLPRSESTVYQFEWMWPFETDQETDTLLGNLADALRTDSDEADTALGNLTADVDTQFLLNIKITSEITPGAIAEFDDGGSIFNKFLFVCAMAGLILGSGIGLIILLFLRRNIYLTGLVAPGAVGPVRLDKQEAELVFGRFTFRKVHLGKRTLTLDGTELTLRFKRSGKVQGLDIRREQGETVITLGRKLRAVELYLAGGKVLTKQWAAIDADRNVYTPAGVIPPVQDRNRTPGGLAVDENGRYSAEEPVHV